MKGSGALSTTNACCCIHDHLELGKRSSCAIGSTFGRPNSPGKHNEKETTILVIVTRAGTEYETGSHYNHPKVYEGKKGCLRQCFIRACFLQYDPCSIAGMLSFSCFFSRRILFSLCKSISISTMSAGRITFEVLCLMLGMFPCVCCAAFLLVKIMIEQKMLIQIL